MGFCTKKELLLQFSVEKTVQLVQVNWAPGQIRVD